MDMILLPEKLMELKRSVKQECLRRNHVQGGSVADWGADSLDFTNQPTRGGIAAVEHYEKTMKPLTAITQTDANETNLIDGRRIINTTEIENALTTIGSLSNISPYTTDQISTGCGLNCTGLCWAACVGSCSVSCADGGNNSCGGCSAGNDGSGCDDSPCTSACYSSCGGSCGSGCGDCTATCSGGANDTHWSCTVHA